LYQRGPTLVPIEIKSGQTVSNDYFKGIVNFRKNFPASTGVVIYGGADVSAGLEAADTRAVAGLNFTNSPPTSSCRSPFPPVAA
jgi:hypothetical protein